MLLQIIAIDAVCLTCSLYGSMYTPVVVGGHCLLSDRKSLVVLLLLLLLSIERDGDEWLTMNFLILCLSYSLYEVGTLAFVYCTPLVY